MALVTFCIKTTKT